MDEEIAALEADLEADPRYVKLRELRRVRELYGVPASTVTELPQRPLRTGGLVALARRLQEGEQILWGRTVSVEKLALIVSQR